jgi:DNA-binding transcriptional LysR family regulator
MRTIDRYDRAVDDRRLLYFVAVAEQLSFSAAAARTHAVQSTVSAGIRSLEQELGIVLFERSPQRVALTPAGAELLPVARRALAGLDELRAVAQHEPAVRGRLRVGVFTNFRAIDLPGILGEFRRRHPAVELQIGPGPAGSTGFLDDVRRGRLDVAFLGLPAAPSGVARHHLAASRFVAVLPHDHPLASAPAVALADLAGERFIEGSAGFGNRVTLDAALAAAGLAREIAVEIADLGEIPRFAAAGLGVAVLPELTVVPAPGAVVRPLQERIDWAIDAITAPEPSPAASALVALLRAETADLRDTP